MITRRGENSGTDATTLMLYSLALASVVTLAIHFFQVVIR